MVGQVSGAGAGDAVPLGPRRLCGGRARRSCRHRGPSLVTVRTGGPGGPSRPALAQAEELAPVEGNIADEYSGLDEEIGVEVTGQAGRVATSSPDPVLRADARRNRDQILAAAAHAFAVSGTDVPMEEIARAAGVGVGTLYRRFADREALVVAVVQHEVERLLGRVRVATAEEPSAFDALVRSMSRARELKLLLPAPNLLPPNLAAAIRDDPVVQRQRRELRELLDTLVEAAQQEGTLRPDVGAGDVAQLFTLVHRARPAGTREVTDLAATRAMAVILDGLRTGPRGSLPGEPLRTGGLERR